MLCFVLGFISLSLGGRNKWKACGGYKKIKSCGCEDGSTWTPTNQTWKQKGPCADETWDIKSCLCADGTTGTRKNRCGRGNFPTQCTCADKSTFNPAEVWGKRKQA